MGKVPDAQSEPIHGIGIPTSRRTWTSSSSPSSELWEWRGWDAYSAAEYGWDGDGWRRVWRDGDVWWATEYWAGRWESSETRRRDFGANDRFLATSGLAG